MKYCPTCGGNLLTKNGEYRFAVPPFYENATKELFGGNEIVIPAAEWLQCERCADQTIPRKLDDAITLKIEEIYRFVADKTVEKS